MLAHAPALPSKTLHFFHFFKEQPIYNSVQLKSQKQTYLACFCPLCYLLPDS
jgi:hypothetical protein